jgi:hypothetical protein
MGRTPTEDFEIDLITPCGDRIARIAAPWGIRESRFETRGKK